MNLAAGSLLSDYIAAGLSDLHMRGALTMLTGVNAGPWFAGRNTVKGK